VECPREADQSARDGGAIGTFGAHLLLLDLIVFYNICTIEVVMTVDSGRPHSRFDYKWVALSNTRVGVLLATIDSSIIQLISSPFQSGLHTAFAFAIGACLLAAVASWSRGRRYVDDDEEVRLRSRPDQRAVPEVACR
jgi:hypothetical protein